MSQNTSARATEAAARLRDLAAYCIGGDLAERLQNAVEDQRKQTAAMNVAADAIDELLLELASERSARWKAENEMSSLSKKVERLSLAVIESWNQNQGGSRDESEH
jgi:hypothetical protein